MGLEVIKHPLVQHKLGLMRKSGISTKSFRELSNEVGSLLTYEATSDFTLETTTIDGWSGEAIEVEQLKGKKVTVVPILRAGIGMLDGVLDLIPNAKVSVVGLYRNEETLEPVSYFDKFVGSLDQRISLVIDPMLATGGSAGVALATLRDSGVKSVKLLSVIASRDGIREVESSFPKTQIYVCAVDDTLNEQKFIVPGLGDAGDRIFNTPGL